MSSHGVLHFVADSVNPILTLLALGVAVFDFRLHRMQTLRRFVIPAALGIACIYIVQAVDHALSLWQRYGGDYSTHTAFATTVVVSLAVRRPAWRWPLAGVLLAYMVLIVFLRFHTVVDVVTAAFVGAVVTLPWHAAARLRADSR